MKRHASPRLLARHALRLALLITVIGAASAVPADAKKGKHHEWLHLAQATQLAPTSTGRVTRVLVNPFGEVDGLLLDNGSLVTFPGHMATELAALVKPGEEVAVHGVPTAGQQIKGLVIRNVATGQTVMDQPKQKGIPKMPKHIRAMGLKDMTANGRIVALRHGKHGELHGVVLEDGTSVRFAKEAAWTAAPLLQLGQTISVTGYGSATPHGRGIEATALGRQDEPQQPIYRR